jgi:hypothetical protein
MTESELRREVLKVVDTVLHDVHDLTAGDIGIRQLEALRSAIKDLSAMRDAIAAGRDDLSTLGHRLDGVASRFKFVSGFSDGKFRADVLTDEWSQTLASAAARLLAAG